METGISNQYSEDGDSRVPKRTQKTLVRCPNPACMNIFGTKKTNRTRCRCNTVFLVRQHMVKVVPIKAKPIEKIEKSE